MTPSSAPNFDEKTFSDLIDCRFPYSDRPASLHLIEMAFAISPKAVFQIVYELACPPPSQSAATRAQRLSLFAEVAGRFHHPLAEVILPHALRLIQKEPIPLSDSLAVMRLVEPFPNQFDALNIAYSNSADDPDGILDQEYQRITTHWK